MYHFSLAFAGNRSFCFKMLKSLVKMPDFGLTLTYKRKNCLGMLHFTLLKPNV